MQLGIDAEGSQGADTKHKVFWVTGCNPGYPRPRSSHQTTRPSPYGRVTYWPRNARAEEVSRR